MQNLLRTFGLVAATVFAMGGVTSAQETPTYSNVEVVSVDAARRIVVLRNSRGLNESFILDDLLAGPGNVRAGDRVIVTMRGGPGRKRISAMSVVSASAPTTVVTPSPVRRPITSELLRTEARESFSRRVATLSQEARPVDTAWSAFVTACDVKPVSNQGGGRDWFGLWDGRVQADYSGGQCRELFNQIVSAGEAIKKGMAAAEEVVKDTLTPGEVRDIRTTHAMNWDGWTLSAPSRREP